MHSLKKRLQMMRELRRATLGWAELEAEAARQGCSAADIVFDRAGRNQREGQPDQRPTFSTDGQSVISDRTPPGLVSLKTVADTIEPLQATAQKVGRVTERLSRKDATRS